MIQMPFGLNLFVTTLIASAVFLGVVDGFLYWTGGSPATISFQVLEASQRYPGIVFVIGLLIGILIGHLLFPQYR